MWLPRKLIPILAVVTLAFLLRNSFKDASQPSFFDLPKKLSAEKLTVQVQLWGTPGGAEVWSLSKSGSADDRLYLLPAKPSQTIPKEYYRLKDSGFVLKLYGSFYKGKGIPQEYFRIQPKPERYPIFRYESLDVVKDN